MGSNRIIMSKANTSVVKPRKTIQNMLEVMEIVSKKKLLPHIQIHMSVKALDSPEPTREGSVMKYTRYTNCLTLYKYIDENIPELPTDVYPITAAQMAKLLSSDVNQ
eukprot:1346767-Ditylum_brightwellii.AAC.2